MDGSSSDVRTVLRHQPYLGRTATKSGGAAEPSDFLNEVATCNASVPPTRSILSTVFVPPTPTQTVLPSGVIPPLKASVPPAARGIAATLGVPPGTAVKMLLLATGSTATWEPLVATRS